MNKALLFNTCYKLTVDVRHSQDSKNKGEPAASSGIKQFKDMLDQHHIQIKELTSQIDSLTARVTRCEDIIIESDEEETEAGERPAKKARKGKGKGTEGKGDIAAENLGWELPMLSLKSYVFLFANKQCFVLAPS